MSCVPVSSTPFGCFLSMSQYLPSRCSTQPFKVFVLPFMCSCLSLSLSLDMPDCAIASPHASTGISIHLNASFIVLLLTLGVLDLLFDIDEGAAEGFAARNPRVSVQS